MKKIDRNFKIKSQKGISLLTLIITVIVIIILAIIVMRGSGGTIDEASIADYKYELKGIEVSVSSKRVENQQEGIGEEFKEDGFYPIIINNPPKDFVSFNGWDIHGYENEKFYGYIVDLDYLKESGTKRGHDFEKYKTFDAEKAITFGREGEDNDVYIYDATGRVYYAKGIYVEGGVYFSDVLEKEDPSDRENDYTEENEETYTITYYFNDGVTESQTQTKSSLKPIRLTPPTKVVREGYILEGWSKDSSAPVAEYKLGELFNENANTNLYAVWKAGEAEKYTVTFNANGGFYGIKSIQKTEGEAVTLPSEIPTKEGYTFEGWSKNSKAIVGEYDAGGEYAEEGNTILFAIWKAGDVRVEINISPDTSVGKAIKSGTEKTGNTIYITAIANEGYVFDKWSLAPNSVNVALVDTYSETTKFIMPEGTVSLIANFKLTDYDYTIKYDVQNGTGTPNTQYKKHGENINISNSQPTRRGHTFIGWTDTLSSDVVKYMPGAIYSRDENVILYAIWVKDSKVILNANGGNIENLGAAKTVITIKYGKTYGEAAGGFPNAVRDGYIFAGWYTEAIGGNKITSDTIITSSVDGQILYAHWEKAPAIAIYSSDDNSLTFYRSAKDVKVGDTYNNKTVTAVYTGFETANYENPSYLPWYSYSNSITKVIVKDKINPISTAWWFYGFRNLTSVDISKLDTSEVINMCAMFCYCENLTNIDVTKFDTKNVTDMSQMFQNCTNLINIDVSNFDTKNVTSMSQMFAGSLKLSSFNGNKNRKGDVDGDGILTYDEATHILYASIFGTEDYPVDLEIADINGNGIIDNKDALAIQEYLASGATDIIKPPLNFDTSKVTNMSQMFSGCIGLKVLDLVAFDTKNANMKNMFNECIYLQEVNLGPKFVFTGTEGYLPKPSKTNIEGADGKWYNTTTKEGYDPEDIPVNKTATYTAISPNSAPTITMNEIQDRTTNKITIKVKATDKNDDNLTYTLWMKKDIETIYKEKGKAEDVAQNTEVLLEISGLEEHTKYNYYVVVTDGSLEDKTSILDACTWCTGIGEICDSAVLCKGTKDCTDVNCIEGYRNCNGAIRRRNATIWSNNNRSLFKVFRFFISVELKV